MEALQLTIEPRGPFATPLHGDTLFGHLCWAARDRYGEDRLGSALAAARPPFIVADALPQGYLPRPIMPPPVTDESVDYQEMKRLKKRRHLSGTGLAQISGSMTPRAVIDKLLLDDAQTDGAGPVSTSRPGVRIDRLSGAAAKGALFERLETWYHPEARLDCYVLYNPDVFTREELLRLWTDIGETGFGKQASIGRGRFRVADVTDRPAALTTPESGYFMSLSPGVPDGGCEVMSGLTRTTFPKHGPVLAVRGLAFKNPVRLYLPGTLYRVTDPDRPVYGKALSHVSREEGHVHPAYLLPYYVNPGGGNL